MRRTLAIMVAWCFFALTVIYILQVNNLQGVVIQSIKQEFKP